MKHALILVVGRVGAGKSTITNLLAKIMGLRVARTYEVGDLTSTEETLYVSQEQFDQIPEQDVAVKIGNTCVTYSELLKGDFLITTPEIAKALHDKVSRKFHLVDFCVYTERQLRKKRSHLNSEEFEQKDAEENNAYSSYEENHGFDILIYNNWDVDYALNVMESYAKIVMKYRLEDLANGVDPDADAASFADSFAAPETEETEETEEAEVTSADNILDVIDTRNGIDASATDSDDVPEAEVEVTEVNLPSEEEAPEEDSLELELADLDDEVEEVENVPENEVEETTDDPGDTEEPDDDYLGFSLDDEEEDEAGDLSSEESFEEETPDASVEDTEEEDVDPFFIDDEASEETEEEKTADADNHEDPVMDDVSDAPEDENHGQDEPEVDETSRETVNDSAETETSDDSEEEDDWFEEDGDDYIAVLK